MRRERLILITDETGMTVLQAWTGATLTGEYTFKLPPEFSLGDVHGALLATGWGDERAGEVQLVNWLRCETIGSFVEEMFSYFARPGEPREELLRIRDSVAALAPQQHVAAIPLFAFAWLDLIVRDDLSDAARSVQDVWSQRSIALDIDAIRGERVRELLGRYAVATTQHLSPSARKQMINHPKYKRGG